jgi:hypothetical protein
MREGWKNKDEERLEGREVGQRQGLRKGDPVEVGAVGQGSG